MYILGGLTAGATIGLLIIVTRLVAALGGGEGAPDLQETIINLSINGAAITIFGFLFSRDLQQKDKDAAVVAREEALALLQARVSRVDGNIVAYFPKPLMWLWVSGAQ